MWGTLIAIESENIKERFIPTHVGNALIASFACEPDAVHPHACGERAGNRNRKYSSCGSSPRMWGTRRNLDDSWEGFRFIPTHVGNALPRLQLLGRKPVHPHACGERHQTHSISAIDDGSSPRMWGTRSKIKYRVYLPRFIPTHVGNASDIQVSTVRKTVHPHACGERLIHKDRRPIKRGSSPRMWGTHTRPSRLRHVSRFIPTHVGNAVTSCAHPYRHAVHPHACGERADIGIIQIACSGSSPRMWGTLAFGVEERLN